MKVYGIDPKTVTTSGTKATQTSNIDFQTVLRGQLESLNKPEQAISVAGPGPVSTLAASPAIRIEGLALTEASLNTLEAFSLALGNPRYDAATLTPFIDTLEEETSALIALRNQLPDEDPLSTILDRVSTQTYLEASKFNRGDYTA